jgi:hypothetical protein
MRPVLKSEGAWGSMPGMKTTLALLALLFSACFSFSQDAAPLAPRIVCDEPVYDFGERENTEVVEHHYLVRNEGDLSLEIRGVRASCGCTAVKPEDSVVPPGGQTKIQARFDLRGRRGTQIKTITVQSNDPNTPNLNLQIRGNAAPGLHVQPSTLFFGRVGPDGARVRTFEIVDGRRPFSVVEMRAENPGLIVKRLEPEADVAAASHRYELTLDPSLPGGTLNSRLVATLAYAESEETRELAVPVAAFIVAP